MPFFAIEFAHDARQELDEIWVWNESDTVRNMQISTLDFCAARSTS